MGTKVLIRTNSLGQVALHVGLVVVIVILIALLVFYVYLPYATNHRDALKVPQLKGVSVSGLAPQLQEAGFELIIDDSVYSKEVPPNTILEQNPSAGTQVKRGRKIYVTISPKNLPTVKVPELRGASTPIAMARLKSLNLEVGNISFRPDLVNDAVLEMSFQRKILKKNDVVPVGSRIDLVIGNGLGEEEFDVPDLEGMNRDQAEDTLRKLGLQIGVVKIDRQSEEPEGTIVKQNPAAYLEKQEELIEDEDGNMVKRKDLEEKKQEKLKQSNPKTHNKDPKKDKKKDKKKGPPNRIRAGEIIDIWISGNKNPPKKSKEQ